MGREGEVAELAFSWSVHGLAAFLMDEGVASDILNLLIGVVVMRSGRVVEVLDVAGKGGRMLGEEWRKRREWNEKIMRKEGPR